ncbi:MAG: amidohydrolase family protein, partial [Cyclobacteriaceae bacterium]
MKKLTLALSLLLITYCISAQRTLIYAGNLIDGVTKKSMKEQTIVVEGKSIKDIKSGYENAKEGDIVIDLRNHTVMPGWIDMHVHVEGETSPSRYIKAFTQNPADVALFATDIARRTLMAGFTTVRDAGGSGVNVSLRNAIAKGYVAGPRIFTAEKGLGVTGGHADPTNGYRADLMGDPGPKDGVVNGIADARK